MNFKSTIPWFTALVLQACLLGGGGTGGEGLTGIIVDAGGVPVAGAKVRVYALASPSARPDSTLTDDGGEFRFKRLRRGDYNLHAFVGSRDSGDGLFLTRLNYDGSLDLGADTLRETGGLRLIVRGEAGEPVAGGTCSIPASPWEDTSDADGMCDLEGLPPATYTVAVAAPGLSTVSGSVRVTSGTGVLVPWTLSMPEESWLTVGAPGYSYRIPAGLELTAASEDEPANPDEWFVWYVGNPPLDLYVGLDRVPLEALPDTFPGYSKDTMFEDDTLRAERISYRQRSLQGEDSAYVDVLSIKDKSSGSPRLHFKTVAYDPGQQAIAMKILNSVKKWTGPANPPRKPPLLLTQQAPRQDSAGLPLSPTLAWAPVEDADSYHLQVSTDSLFLALIVDDSLLSASARTVGPLDQHARYYWRVRARTGAFVSGYSETRRFTTAGYAWIKRNTFVSDTLTGVAYSGTSYGMVTAPFRFMHSADGANWVTTIAGDVATLSESSIAWFGNYFVSTDDLGILTLVLANGTYGNTAYQIGSPTKPLHAMLVDGSNLLVAGTGEVHVVSTDYSARNTYPLGVAAAVRGLARRSGVYAAVLDNGGVFTSTDLTTWTARASGTDRALYAATAGTGGFVAVGAGGTILRSLDGIAWTAVSSGTDASLYGVAFEAGTYLAVGARGTLLYSRDGEHWVPHAPSLTGNDLRFVTLAGNKWFIGGVNGDLFTTP